MRFTALLLLAALAGALVCAQDTTAGPAQPTEDPASLQSDAPQETTIAAQTSAAAQEPTTKQRKNLLESVIEKGRSDLKDVIAREKKKVDERIQKAKDGLKKILDPSSFFP
ncbi:extracellular glycoprotein lacritin-like [Myotis yumanensis]|uniref:extracellular glycoprotein lacritin-like n=1 Tax=Myotis yumanensis TaxID=159337 RepID=UPI0038D09C70